MKKRIDYIDIAKFIGIILVFIGHRTGGIIESFVYSFHMPLFFFLSGLTLKNKNNKFWLEDK